MIIWQTNKQLNRVLGGKKVELGCSGCLKQSIFYESEIEENLKLYFVIDLWKRTKKILQCGACLGICDYYEIFPAEKQAEEAAEAERKRKETVEKELRKQQEAAAALKRKLDLEQEEKRREAELQRLYQEEYMRKQAEKAQKAADVEDELAKLKKKIGK